jgi:thiamine-phosphate pyrophosphorylase
LSRSEKVFRLLDVNLNRAREGLRVLEDTARLVREDKKVFEELRSIRHALDRITRRAYPRLIQARDSVRDPGRTVPEGEKRSPSGLVAANFRRAEEAVRVLEEYGKVLAPSAAARFKALRYRLYEAEKKAYPR